MATATAETITQQRIANAWNEYLTAIRETTNPISYTEVEATAWAKLQTRLRRIQLTS